MSNRQSYIKTSNCCSGKQNTPDVGKKSSSMPKVLFYGFSLNPDFEQTDQYEHTRQELDHLKEKGPEVLTYPDSGIEIPQ